ncbi:alpha/beta-hydrolase [Xylariomycetidae sp. FL2044]|nr:alpha/beta-hydrolase [Xylariomycetidae sp. FL2044]
MGLKDLLLFSSLCLERSSASVTVRKTNRGPTGYEVDFRYVNTSVESVTLGGGLPLFSDAYHTSMDAHSESQPTDWQPGDFPVGDFQGSAAWAMERSDDGVWTYTLPLPSGTFSYAYLTDCPYTPNCTLDTGKRIVDPDNPPFVNVVGDQSASIVQVPFDEEFQRYAEFNTNFDFALPVPAEHRGEARTVNYSSPGSVHPAQDIHEFTVYLPANYSGGNTTTYPVLYLSHGAGGNGEDWENLGQMSHIMDRLVMDGHLEPTVVVMPSFYNLNASYPFAYGAGGSGFPPSSAMPMPPLEFVRESYMAYLMPFVEASFSVAAEPARRAFAGLSMGGALAYEMYQNATDYFDYYGMFSGASSSSSAGASVVEDLAANPALAGKGLFLAAGLYDFAFDSIREAQAALDGAGIRYISRVTPYGFHAWNTWQDHLWEMGKTSLWKAPVPFTDSTNR